MQHIDPDSLRLEGEAAFDAKAPPLLRASASSMMWNYEIVAISDGKNAAGVFWNASDELRSLTGSPLGRIKRENLLRGVCATVLDCPEVTIQARDPGCISIELLRDANLEPFHHDLLAACWMADPDISRQYGEYFVHVPDEELRQITSIAGGLFAPCVTQFVRTLLHSEISSWGIDLARDEIYESVGPMESTKFFDEAKRYIEEYDQKKTKARRQKDEKEVQRVYGDEELCKNISALTNKYKDRIQPGYLVHAAHFDPPPLGEELIWLLASWLRSKHSFPDNLWPPTNPAGGRHHVLVWLLGGRQKEGMQWLKQNPHPRAKEIYEALLQMSNEASRDLQEGLGPRVPPAASIWRYQKRWLSDLGGPE
jgi:hypothetical protein